ncbi:hypothetical protein ACHAW5_000698 [Stephanodiscus triporus]|uniref:Uncharacterized protein n=1 Tax=Stephanodiscus triporus TaxID=2934178 RepID=A0ABD3P3B0_9STRA
MPSLRNMNVHPRMRDRLSSRIDERRKRPRSSSSSSLDAKDVRTQPEDDAAPPPPPPPTPFAPVRTPSALLSRDPAILSSSIGVSLEDVMDVRASVALGIICDPHGGHGRQAAEAIEEVTRFCVEENEEEGGKEGGVEGATGLERGGMGIRPTAMMAGAVTALDACARARALMDVVDSKRAGHHGPVGRGYRWRSREQLDCIKTGSVRVDGLLAPDDAHSSFVDGWGMPRPYKLPGRRHRDNVDERHYAAGYPSSPNIGCLGGVPFGMVTEFSGPPSSGKTQLALSIAAHAVVESGLRVCYISSCCGRKALSRRLYAMFAELARRPSSSAVDDAAAVVQGRDGVHGIVTRAMERVDIAYVPDAHSLLATLARIDHDEEVSRRRIVDGTDDAEGSEENGTLLVIDSVSGCLGHHLSSDVGAALVSQVALTLRHMVRTHDSRLLTNGAVIGACRPRRFAVVLTNGSVAKRSSENKLIGSSSSISLAVGHSQNKPAMGRYWHASDVGLWLEEVGSSSRDNRQIDFHDHNTRVVGLSLAENKVIRATLQNHYGKSCKGNDGGKRSGKPFAKFEIHSGGISDT